MNKCTKCGEYLADIVASYSMEHFGKYLCQKHQFIEKYSYKKELSFCCGAPFLGESDFCSDCKEHSGPDYYMDKVQDEEQKWGEERSQSEE